MSGIAKLFTGMFIIIFIMMIIGVVIDMFEKNELKNTLGNMRTEAVQLGYAEWYIIDKTKGTTEFRWKK